MPVDSSSGKLFVDDLTPRTIDEFMVGTARQFNRAAGGARLLALPRRQPLLGGHEQQRPRSPSTRRPASRASCTSRTCAAQARRRSAAARPTSSPSSTAPTRSTTRRRPKPSGAADSALRARLVHLEPLLRQLRPGQLDDGQRRQRLHRLVVHRRRRRPSAVGLQGRRPARRPPAHVQAVRLLQAAHGTRRPAPSSSRSRVSRGRRGATSPTSR